MCARGRSRNFERGGINQKYDPELLKRGAQVETFFNSKSKIKKKILQKGGQSPQAPPLVCTLLLR